MRVFFHFFSHFISFHFTTNKHHNMNHTKHSETDALHSLFDIDLDSDDDEDSGERLEAGQRGFLVGLIEKLKTVSPSVASDIARRYIPLTDPEARLIQRVAKGYLGRQRAETLKVEQLLDEQQKLLTKSERWHEREKEENTLDRSVEAFFTDRMYDEALKVKRQAARQTIARWLRWCVGVRRKKKSAEENHN